jgi:hypothetical protein
MSALPTASKEAFVDLVLFDVSGVTLFRGVMVFLCLFEFVVVRCPGKVTWLFASVSRRHNWHVTRHE